MLLQEFVKVKKENIITIYLPELLCLVAYRKGDIFHSLVAQSIEDVLKNHLSMQWKKWFWSRKSEGPEPFALSSDKYYRFLYHFFIYLCFILISFCISAKSFALARQTPSDSERFS